MNRTQFRPSTKYQVPITKYQVPSTYLASFLSVKPLLEVFLTKQPLFFPQFMPGFSFWEIPAYFFANNKRLTPFMEQEVSLVNTNAHKMGSHLRSKK
jgi:hypothetical protein